MAADGHVVSGVVPAMMCTVTAEEAGVGSQSGIASGVGICIKIDLLSPTELKPGCISGAGVDY